jgi:hypothetical protein
MMLPSNEYLRSRSHLAEEGIVRGWQGHAMNGRAVTSRIIPAAHAFLGRHADHADARMPPAMDWHR